MPLPLIPIIFGTITLVTGGAGVAKGVKAVMDNNEANDINENAQNIIDNAQGELKTARDNTSKALTQLGNKKIDICDKHLAHFIASFEKLKNVELETSIGLEELAKFKIDKQSITALKKVTLLATSLASGTAGGAVAGAAVAFGAYGAAGALATASTGTAIATLSGAAATNATLAFFGGGALAAGGCGVAGGTMVLGGLVAGPALAVLGFVMGAKACSNLDNARSNLATAKEVKAKLEVLTTACNGIKKRSDLFTRTLIKLESILNTQLAKFEYIIATEGVDYSKFSDSSKNLVAMLLGTVQAVKALLDTPLLNDAGALTDESEKVVNSVKGLLEA